MNAVKDLRSRCALTQRELAEAAKTSQPTIAAYEAGRKSPSLRTIARMARAVGLEATIDFVPQLTREDRRSLALHEAIAKHLEEQPAATLAKARRNLERMLENNPGAEEVLTRWRNLLTRPISEIVEVLRDARPSARELRHVTPFAGVLSARERADVYRQFAAAEVDSP